MLKLYIRSAASNSFEFLHIHFLIGWMALSAMYCTCSLDISGVAANS